MTTSTSEQAPDLLLRVAQDFARLGEALSGSPLQSPFEAVTRLMGREPVKEF